VGHVIETLHLAGLPLLLVILEDSSVGVSGRVELLALFDVLLGGACIFHAVELGKGAVLVEGAHVLGDVDEDLHFAFLVRKLPDELVNLEVGHTAVTVQLLRGTHGLLLEQGLVVELHAAQGLHALHALEGAVALEGLQLLAAERGLGFGLAEAGEFLGRFSTEEGVGFVHAVELVQFLD